MAYSELTSSFDRVRDHAWQAYIRTIDECLPAEKVLSAIVERETALFDLVYFFGRAQDTALLIDELLQKYTAAHQSRNVIRMKAQDIITFMFDNIYHHTNKPILPKVELNSCDLFVLEHLDAIAGSIVAEEPLYGVLDRFLENHAQIVITGNVRLADMWKLAPRIRAQLDGGISCLVK